MDKSNFNLEMAQLREENKTQKKLIKTLEKELQSKKEL